MVSVPATVQSRPMPRIMQKSQKPLMRRALTAVRSEAGLAADRDQAVQRDQQALPEERGTKLSARTAPLAKAAVRKSRP